MSLRLTKKFREGEKDGSLKKGWFGTLPKRKSISWLVQPNEPQPGSTSYSSGLLTGIASEGTVPPDDAPTILGKPVASNVKGVQWEDSVSRQSAESGTVEPQMSGACVTPDRTTKKPSGHTMTKGLRKSMSYLHMSPTKSLSKAFKNLRSPRKEKLPDPTNPVVLAEDEQIALGEAPLSPVETEIPTVSDVVIPSCDLALSGQSREPANCVAKGEVVAEAPRTNSEPNRQVTPAKSTIAAPFSSLKQHWTEQVISAAELDIHQAKEGQKEQNGCNNTQIALTTILSESPSHARDVADQQQSTSSTVLVSTEPDSQVTPVESAATSLPIPIPRAHPGSCVLVPQRRPSIQRTTSLRRDLDRLVDPTPSASRKPSGAYEADMEDNSNPHQADHDELQHRSTSPTSSDKKLHSRKRTIIPWKSGIASRDDLPSQQGLAGLGIGLRQSNEQLCLLQRNSSQDESKSSVSGYPSSMLGREAAECKNFRMTLDPVNAEIFQECAARGVCIQWDDAVEMTTLPFDADGDDIDEEEMSFNRKLYKARMDAKWTSGRAKTEEGQRTETRHSTDSGLGSSIISRRMSTTATNCQETKIAAGGEEASKTTKNVSIEDRPPPYELYELSATTPTVSSIKDTTNRARSATGHAIEYPFAVLDIHALESPAILVLEDHHQDQIEETFSLPSPAGAFISDHHPPEQDRIEETRTSVSSPSPTTTSIDPILSALERYLVGGPLTTLKTGHRHRKLFLDPSFSSSDHHNNNIVHSPEEMSLIFPGPEDSSPESWKLPDPMIPLPPDPAEAVLLGRGVGEKEYLRLPFRPYPTGVHHTKLDDEETKRDDRSVDDADIDGKKLDGPHPGDNHIDENKSNGKMKTIEAVLVKEKTPLKEREKDDQQASSSSSFRIGDRIGVGIADNRIVDKIHNKGAKTASDKDRHNPPLLKLERVRARDRPYSEEEQRRNMKWLKSRNAWCSERCKSWWSSDSDSDDEEDQEKEGKAEELLDVSGEQRDGLEHEGKREGDEKGEGGEEGDEGGYSADDDSGYE